MDTATVVALQTIWEGKEAVQAKSDIASLKSAIIGLKTDVVSALSRALQLLPSRRRTIRTPWETKSRLPQSNDRRISNECCLSDYLLAFFAAFLAAAFFAGAFFAAASFGAFFALAFLAAFLAVFFAGAAASGSA